MRKTVAMLTLTAAAALALTACSSAPAPDCEGQLPDGGGAALVEATGEFGEKPDVVVPTPLVAENSAREIAIAGDGRVAGVGSTVRVDATILDGETGELISEGLYGDLSEATMLTLDESSVIAPVVKGLACAAEGSRVIIAASPEDTGQASSIVYVLDLVQVFPVAAEGFAAQLPDGFPAVVTNDRGVPGIIVPNATPPSELRVETRIAGDGETVEDGDTVLVEYTGVLWDGGTVFDSSWESGEAVMFSLPDQVIPGMSEALIGQKVGSQVVAIIPPDLAYGDQGQGTIPAGATLVFVVDILGVV